MQRILILVLGLLSFSVAARADIYDRINQCQTAGGGTCVFDLLRELAAGGSNPSGALLSSGTYVPSSNNGSVTIDSAASAISLAWVGLADRTNGTYTCQGFTCTLTTDATVTVQILTQTSFRLTASGYSDSFTLKSN